MKPEPTPADIAAAKEYAESNEPPNTRGRRAAYHGYLAGRMDGIAAERERAAQVAEVEAAYADPSKRPALHERDAKDRELGFLVASNIASEIRRGPQT